MKLPDFRNMFHRHKFEVRAVNHYLHNNDFVTRMLKICKCGQTETALVAGIWQLEDLTPRNSDFDKEFARAARICELEKHQQ